MGVLIINMFPVKVYLITVYAPWRKYLQNIKKKNIFHIQNIRLTIDVNKDGKNIEDLKQI